MVKKRLTDRLRVPAFDRRHHRPTLLFDRAPKQSRMYDGADQAIRPENLRVAPSLFWIASFMRMVGGIALWKSTHASRSFCRGHRWIADGGSSLINLILKPRMKSRGFQPKPRKAGAGSNTISFAIRVPMAALASTQIGGHSGESWVLAMPWARLLGSLGSIDGLT
jgi:hypothetical protein